MLDIILLTDYKNYFGSKKFSDPYRSGMDRKLLKKHFTAIGLNIKFISFSDINFANLNFSSNFVLYTSSEDIGGYYKKYIEDIIYGLSINGVRLIPEYKYLKAHNNKVFMEILRDSFLRDLANYIPAKYFGTYEECINCFDYRDKLYVIKKSSGAMGKGVYLSQNKSDFLKKIKLASRTRMYRSELWDIGRAYKRSGYVKESKFRNKFIVQEYIPNLNHDWKVLVFGNKYYVLYRKNRKNDFRASGSGNFRFREDVPKELLNFAKDIYTRLNVPNLSLDIAKNDRGYFLIEFQAIYFGTTTIEKSPFFFKKNNGNWEIFHQNSILEQEYANSVFHFLEKNELL